MSEEDEFLPESDYRKWCEQGRKGLPEIPDFFSKENVQKWMRDKDHAVLDESGNVIPATLMEWARWFESSRQRYIAQDFFEDKKFMVSTVFMGLNHNYSSHPNAKPHWFETMVFGEAREESIPEAVCGVPGYKHTIRPDLWVSRCATLAEAKAQHQEGINWLKANKLESQ